MTVPGLELLPEAGAKPTQDPDAMSIAASESKGKQKKVQTGAQKATTKLRDIPTITVENGVWLRKLQEASTEELCLGCSLCYFNLQS